MHTVKPILKQYDYREPNLNVDYINGYIETKNVNNGSILPLLKNYNCGEANLNTATMRPYTET